MDVADSTIWKVIINDKIHSLKIDTSAHQLCGDEEPHLTRPEAFDNVVTLKGVYICIYIYI